MSLLLDALKKAEEAKRKAAAGESADAPADDAIELSPIDAPVDPVVGGEPATEPALSPEAQPGFMTRDRLPDISQPLEILADDLAEPTPQRPPGGKPPSARAATSAASGAAAAASATSARRSTGAETVAKERDAVRKMFEAKQVDYNPRRPFFITLGVLALVAVGAGAYFWYQLQPRSSFEVAGSIPTTSEPAAPAQPPVAVAPVAPVAPAQPSPGPVAQGPAATPTEPAAQSAAPAAATAAPPARTAPKPAARRSAATSARPAPAASGSAERRPQASGAAPAPQRRSAVQVKPSSRQLDADIVRGYEAFQAGDIATANQAYSRALQRNPLSRDALLGLAAVDVRNQDFASAEARYRKLLELDPRDPYAQAGLASLRGQADALQAESRLKTLLTDQPDSAQLNFALGNQFASQASWSEAQAAYFRAFTAEPDNPDFAYNLAVSLDQLRQRKLAAEYYQKALDLARSRPASFDAAQAARRIRELAS